MNNGEVYKIARANLVKKIEQIGYVRLVTDCWGMLVEFEKEWHRQNGGQSRIKNMFPMYSDEKTMRQMMREANLDTEQMIHNINWKHIDGNENAFEVGDCAAIMPSNGQDVWYTLFFYTGDSWETSSGRDDRMFDVISDYGALRHIGKIKYLGRKKSWSEKERIVSDIDPNP